MGGRISIERLQIDTGNYYPRQRDGKIEGIENGLPESRWVEQQLGHPVIKVFNNINTEYLANGGKPAFSQDQALGDQFWK